MNNIENNNLNLKQMQTLINLVKNSKKTWFFDNVLFTPIGIFMILLILKLSNVIDWPWYAITVPLWLPFVILFAALIVTIAFVVVTFSLVTIVVALYYVCSYIYKKIVYLISIFRERKKLNIQNQEENIFF